MTIIENTGRGPACPICNSTEYGSCGHLVADFDRTYGECLGGEIYDRQAEFSDLAERAFLMHLNQKTVLSVKKWGLDELWEITLGKFDPDEEYVELDGDIFQRVLIALLKDSGAFDVPEGLIDPGGPSMTSWVSLLFADDPSKVIDMAINKLKIELH
ncbi:hypothetical protein LCGC14_1241090 [marine sediment metagenome]|uniref:Uncharacterized protein n=1 Tax=marine sediment metagenome TaxID=412755 RepID=A0A0F9PA01_9ZZZZ